MGGEAGDGPTVGWRFTIGVKRGGEELTSGKKEGNTPEEDEVFGCGRKFGEKPANLGG